MTLDEAREHVGAGVVYRPRPDASAEDGTITSVNERWVFVRYTGNPQPQATAPQHLTLLADTIKETR